MKNFFHVRASFLLFASSRRVCEQQTPDGMRPQEAAMPSKLEATIPPKNADYVNQQSKQFEDRLGQMQTRADLKSPLDDPFNAAKDAIRDKVAKAKEAVAGFLQEKGAVVARTVDNLKRQPTPVAEVPEGTQELPDIALRVEDPRKPAYTMDASGKIRLNDVRTRLTQVKGFEKAQDGQVVTITRKDGSRIDAVYDVAAKDYLINGKHAPIYSGDTLAKGEIRDRNKETFSEKEVAKVKETLEAIGKRIFEASKAYEETVAGLPPDSSVRYDEFQKLYKVIAAEFAKVDQYDQMLRGFNGVPKMLDLTIAGMKVRALPGSLEKNFRGMVITPGVLSDMTYFSKQSLSGKMMTEADKRAAVSVARNMPGSTPAVRQMADSGMQGGKVRGGFGTTGAPQGPAQ